MTKQLLLNRGFENELVNYITLGSVSTDNDIAYSGIKAAQLLATPTSIAEISQVVFFIKPGSPVRFSFFSRRFLSEDVKNVSNIRAEVNFISLFGTIIPPGIVITIRGCDISENAWNCYEEYAEVPIGTLATQVVIRLEPPAEGVSGLLVDDLALVSETEIPAPPLAPAPPVQPGIQAFPGFPFVPPSVPAPQGTTVIPGRPFTNQVFPGSTSANINEEDPGILKQEDQALSPSKIGNTADTE